MIWSSGYGARMTKSAIYIGTPGLIVIAVTRFVWKPLTPSNPHRLQRAATVIVPGQERINHRV